MITALFETFNVAGVYIGDSAVLAPYASGRTTGVVLNSADDSAYSVAIYEGPYQ